LAALADQRLEPARRSICGQHAGVIGREAQFAFHSAALGIGQFGQAFAAFFEERVVEFQRQQVGIGEIAIIVRVLFGAHRPRFPCRDRTAGFPARLLPPILDQIDLPPRFIFDRLPSRSAPS
jgi:hypothetical protein